jgi:phosphohistidine phosphatase
VSVNGSLASVAVGGIVGHGRFGGADSLGRSEDRRGGLAPNDDPVDVARALHQANEPLLLVGHLPHLARLASLLVVGDATRPVLAFRMAALVALAREGEGFRVRFVLPPDVVME